MWYDETLWETPIHPHDEDICQECGGDANDEGCKKDCQEYKQE